MKKILNGNEVEMTPEEITWVQEYWARHANDIPEEKKPRKSAADFEKELSDLKKEIENLKKK